MASLIITIISIGLFAIAAIMGAYYGGQAYQNAQINATANAIMNEAQQILAAERIWSTNNNQPDISGMGTPASAGGNGMAKLVSSKTLAEWPSFGGTISASTSLTTYVPNTSATYDVGCYNINGYFGKFWRIPFSYNNANYVFYGFVTNLNQTMPCGTYNGYFVGSNTDVSQINHPIVKIVKAINAAMNQVPANVTTTAMSYIGLPYAPAGSTHLSTAYDPSSLFVPLSIYLDANGTLQTNYCYLDNEGVTIGAQASDIDCVFGPS